MMKSGAFLRDDHRSYIGTRLFYHCLAQLGCDIDLYLVPLGMRVAPEQINYYTTHLRTDLAQRSLPTESDALDYVLLVCQVLEGWARAGHSMEVT